jgi:hypothetical protein
MTNDAAAPARPLTPIGLGVAAYVRSNGDVAWLTPRFQSRWPGVATRTARELLDLVHPNDRSHLSAAWSAIHHGQGRCVTCCVRLGDSSTHTESRVRLTRCGDQDPGGIMIHVEDVQMSVASRVRATARDRSYQELRRGAVTAYVRIPRAQEGNALQLLNQAAYIAHRDDGDPDCPPDHADLYIERHYGMTNPDPVIQDLHRTRIAQVFTSAGIGHEERGSGIIFGMPIPVEELHPVLNADTGEALGYTIRAVDLADIDERLTLLAETLNTSRASLTIRLSRQE